MTRTNYFAILCALLLLASGCGSTTTTTEDDSSNNGSSDTGAGGNDGSTGGDASTDGTQAVFTSTEASTAAETAASALAQSLIAVLTVKDLKTIFEDGASMPTCPNMETTIDPGAIVLVLDFAAGCTPAPYTTPILSGTVAASVFTTINAFEATLESLQFNDNSITGTLTGTFATGAGTTTFVLTPSITHEGSTSYSGSATMVFNESTGELTIETASLTVANENQSLTIQITNATITPDAAAGTIPTSGTATVTNLQSAPEQQNFEVTFSP